MKFAIIGIGGVTTPEDYEDYINIGADAVQSGSGAMVDPHLAHKLFEKEKIQMNDYQSAKSIGSAYFSHVARKLNLEDYRKMYLEMVMPRSLSQSKQTLLIREKPFKLKHGEAGRKHSHIYMNHRNPIFVDAWDRKLMVEILDTYIKEKILTKHSEDTSYGVIAIPSSSSPELTASMLDSLHSVMGRSVIIPEYTLGEEKGAHQPMYGDLNNNKTWVMIDDVFTSGKTLQKALNYIPENLRNTKEAVRLFALTLVCRNPHIVENFQKKNNFDMHYLITLEEILKYHWNRFSSIEKKLIRKERSALN